MDFSGRVALVTGAARVGQATAVMLAEAGCRLAIVYNRSDKAAREVEKIAGRFGSDCLLLRADLQKPRDLERIVPAVEKRFGALDIFVHMASPYESLLLPQLSATKNGLLAAEGPWRRSMDVEALAAFWLSLRAAPLLRRRQGRIVLFSDWLPASGRPRYEGFASYYVAKAAVKAVAEYLALVLAPKIRVNAIAPGPILPPDFMSEKERREVARATPLKRWGGPEEVARAVRFLLETEFMTGETIRVDGGRHLY